MVIFGRGGFKDRGPRIHYVRCECCRSMSGRDVFANRVALVPINATLTLLEVDGVSGKVPVDDRVAPPVKSIPPGQQRWSQERMARTAN